jgi:hypothetical protein
MTFARKILLAAAGVLGALALVLGMATVHKPAHVYDGVHAHIYGDVIKAPQHVYDG